MPFVDIFVDSGILIDPIISVVHNKKSNTIQFDKFKKNRPSGVEFSITKRVIQEVKNVFSKINYTLGNFLKELNGFLKNYHDVSEDIIEKYEDYLVNKINKNIFQSNFGRDQNLSILKSFTEWIIDIMNVNKNVQKINKDKLLYEMNSKIQEYVNEIKKYLLSELANYNQIDVKDISDFFDLVFNFTSIRNKNDIKHLSDIFNYQFKNNKWVIFISLDYSDIVSPIHRNELEQIMINVVAPRYIRSRIKKLEQIGTSPIEFLKNRYENINKCHNCIDPEKYNVIVYYPFLVSYLCYLLVKQNLIKNNIKKGIIEYPKQLYVCNELKKNKIVIGRTLKNNSLFVKLKLKDGSQKIYFNDSNVKENDIVILRILKQKTSNIGNIYYRAKIKNTINLS